MPFAGFGRDIISNNFHSLLLGIRNQGILIDPVYPSLTILVIYFLSSILTYIRTELERRRVRRAFGLYISPEYMHELTKIRKSLSLGGEIRDVTVMFYRHSWVY